MGVQIGLKIYYLFSHREGVTLSEMDTALDMMRAKLFMKIWTMTVKECSSEWTTLNITTPYKTTLNITQHVLCCAADSASWEQSPNHSRWRKCEWRCVGAAGGEHSPASANIGVQVFDTNSKLFEVHAGSPLLLIEGQVIHNTEINHWIPTTEPCGFLCSHS